MKIFSRILMVFALLGGLAYGSFAFGKYVLSNKLFGEPTSGSALRTVSRSTGEASAVTRSTGWKGSKPRVEVRVLGADEAGPAPQTSAFADEDNLSTERRTDLRDAVPPSSLDKARKGSRSIDDASVQYSLGDEDNDGDRPRRRRKRRHSSNEKTVKAATARVDASQDSAVLTPEGDGAENENGDSSSISVSAGNDDSSPRSSGHSSSSRSSDDTPRRSRRSRRGSSGSSSSPVPQPEGSTSSSSSGGGDSADISPVPQPE